MARVAARLAAALLGLAALAVAVSAQGKCNVKNCTFCQPNNPNYCADCNVGYYFLYATGKCATCDIKGCGDCVACQTGPDCRNQHKCTIPCSDRNCADCNTTPQKCKLCNRGYYLDLATRTCKPCNLPRCADCEAANVPGGRKCLETCREPECIKCDGDARNCQKCSDKFYLNLRTFNCEKCRIKGCDNCVACYPSDPECDGGRKCVLCSKGFYFYKGDCAPCNLPNCTDCEATATGRKCISCAKGFRLNNGRCTK